MKVKDLLLSAALGYIIVSGVEWDMLFAMLSMWLILTLVIWDILINVDESVRKYQILEEKKNDKY